MRNTISHTSKWPERPYKGLSYFDVEDQLIFGGRDREIQACINALTRSDTRTLLLHGRTGCGKSSFLRAGVIANLLSEGLEFSFLRDREIDEQKLGKGAILRSGRDPVASIAQGIYYEELNYRKHAAPELRRNNKAAEDAANPNDLGQDVLHGTNSLPEFMRTVRNPGKLITSLELIGARRAGTMLVIVDQAEEVLTQSNSAKNEIEDGLQVDQEGVQKKQEVADSFFAFVRQFNGRNRFRSVKLVLAFRKEYFGEIFEHLQLSGTIDVDSRGIRHIFLSDLSVKNIALAIEKPTSKSLTDSTGKTAHEKYRFDYVSGLSSTIADGLRKMAPSGGLLPVMQIVCSDLVQTKRRVIDSERSITITRSDYISKGVRDRIRAHIDGAIRTGLEIPITVRSNGSALSNFFNSVLDRLNRMRLRLLGRISLETRVKRALAELAISAPDGTVITSLEIESEFAKRLVRSGVKGARLGRLIGVLRSPNWRIIRNSAQYSLQSGKQERFYSLGHDSVAFVLKQWSTEYQRTKWIYRWIALFAIGLPLLSIVYIGGSHYQSSVGGYGRAESFLLSFQEPNSILRDPVLSLATSFGAAKAQEKFEESWYPLKQRTRRFDSDGITIRGKQTVVDTLLSFPSWESPVAHLKDSSGDRFLPSPSETPQYRAILPKSGRAVTLTAVRFVEDEIVLSWNLSKPLSIGNHQGDLQTSSGKTDKQIESVSFDIPWKQWMTGHYSLDREIPFNLDFGSPSFAETSGGDLLLMREFGRIGWFIAAESSGKVTPLMFSSDSVARNIEIGGHDLCSSSVCEKSSLLTSSEGLLLLLASKDSQSQYSVHHLKVSDKGVGSSISSPALEFSPLEKLMVDRQRNFVFQSGDTLILADRISDPLAHIPDLHKQYIKLDNKNREETLTASLQFDSDALYERSWLRLAGERKFSNFQFRALIDPGTIRPIQLQNDTSLSGITELSKKFGQISLAAETDVALQLERESLSSLFSFTDPDLLECVDAIVKHNGTSTDRCSLVFTVSDIYEEITLFDIAIKSRKLGSQSTRSSASPEKLFTLDYELVMTHEPAVNISTVSINKFGSELVRSLNREEMQSGNSALGRLDLNHFQEDLSRLQLVNIDNDDSGLVFAYRYADGRSFLSSGSESVVFKGLPRLVAKTSTVDRFSVPDSGRGSMLVGVLAEQSELVVADANKASRYYGWSFGRTRTKTRNELIATLDYQSIDVGLGLLACQIVGSWPTEAISTRLSVLQIPTEFSLAPTQCQN